MSGLGDFLKVISEGKKDYSENDPTGKLIASVRAEVKENVKSDLSDLFSQLSSIKKEVEILPEETEGKKEAQQIIAEVLPEPIKEEETLVDEQTLDMDEVNKYLTGKTFQQPNPDAPSRDVDDIRKKIKHLEQWLGKISAHGPGSGEVRLEFLDDVNRNSAKQDGKYLKYDATTKKWIGDTIETGDVVYNTTLVETDTYIVQDGDWYIGVNYAGTVTITLPSTATNGRVLVIKDESGNASTNPINASGTVDNDAGGFSLQMDNGGIQMVYRSGWRVI